MLGELTLAANDRLSDGPPHLAEVAAEEFGDLAGYGGIFMHDKHAHVCRCPTNRTGREQ
jgi:hypothetical protein